MGRIKTILSPETTQEIIKLYTVNLLGTPSIATRFSLHKSIINRTLKENGIPVGPSGRKYTGGKSVSDKRHYEKNKEKRLRYHKEWSKGKQDDLRIYHSQWREGNTKLAEYKKNYERKRRASDPKYRLGHRTRTAVWMCLKERNIEKSKNTFKLLGYHLEDLMHRLESTFSEGMTWNNYGEWHLDHIKPMASFNFTSTDDEEFKKCWALENLQALWAADNYKKGSNF